LNALLRDDPGTYENRPPTRILVTGAGGFAGRHLMAHLIEEARKPNADPVHITATFSPHGAAGKPLPSSAANCLMGWQGGDEGGLVSSVVMEMRDKAAIERTVAEVRPQQIYHLAARASGADIEREAMFAVNVGGTRSLLDAAALITPFPRVLAVSTGYVYGNVKPERPAREDDPLGPFWSFGPYTDSKLEMESVARSYRAFVIVARAFAHTGAGQTPSFAIPAFARQLARMEAGLEEPTLRVGNLTALRDLLDVRDVVKAYRLLMLHGERGTAYNVASGNPYSMQNLLDRMRGLCRVPTEIATDPARMRPADIACSSGDFYRLHSLTEWLPRIPLDETLETTLDYWRASVEVS
jgi:GDP-4-dehydro-6-deoxy-D-mannose reductase